MGWWTGKPKTPRVPVKCRQCSGRKRVPRLGLAPGGVWVHLPGTDPCPGCNGRARV